MLGHSKAIKFKLGTKLNTRNYWTLNQELKNLPEH